MPVRSRSIRLSSADRKQQILKVAMELFARKGFQGTTTKEIAKRARVNEAIIFRHFPSKEELYWGVIEGKCRHGQKRRDLEKRLRESHNTRDMFVALATEWLNRETTMSRLLFFSALENHRLSQRFFRTHVAKYYEVLAEYIRVRIASGEFRNVDPRLAARGFVGMVVYHFLIQELFGGKRYQNFDSKKVAETFTDIWLAGVTCANHSNGFKSKNGFDQINGLKSKKVHPK